jgi:hypothetical protein
MDKSWTMEDVGHCHIRLLAATYTMETLPRACCLWFVSGAISCVLQLSSQLNILAADFVVVFVKVSQPF